MPAATIGAAIYIYDEYPAFGKTGFQYQSGTSF